jgi:hypothetical protein
MVSVLERRLALRNNGYIPVPCKGKEPLYKSWQKARAYTDKEIARWGGDNTGVLTTDTTALDIDIMHPDAAEAAEEMVKNRLGDLGEIPVRIGQWPKRVMLFRTEVPFAKMIVQFAAREGRKKSDKLEVLCKGQQVIADGVHPDTRKPYVWHNDRGPLVIPHKELLPVTEDEMHELLGDLTEMLTVDFGFAEVKPSTGAGNDAGPAEHWDSLVREGADDGQRNTMMPRVAGHLLKTLPPGLALAALRVWNQRSRPPEEERKVVSTLLSIARRELPARCPGRAFSNAEILAMDEWPGQGPQEESIPPKLILSSKEFISGFVAPNYLIEGVLLRGYCYSLTGRTNAGKTAVALTIAASVAERWNIGDHEVDDKCKVLVLAGENPTDVQARWLAMSEHMNFDADTIGVYFIPGVFKVSALQACVAEEVNQLGGVGLIVVDTSAAYFEGDDENQNVQAIAHAKMMRKFCEYEGRPTVLIGCHPTKNASDDLLLPRGGGSFLNEVDGNLTGANDNMVVKVHWCGKIRGPDFEPMYFTLDVVTSEKVKDAKGRLMPTAIARPLSEHDHDRKLAESYQEDEDLLLAVECNDGASLKDMAIACNWYASTGRAKGQPYKVKVQRKLEKLKKEKLVEKPVDKWTLTQAGRDKAKAIKAARESRSNSNT